VRLVNWGWLHPISPATVRIIVVRLLEAELRVNFLRFDSRLNCTGESGGDQTLKWRSSRTGSDARASRTRRLAHSESDWYRSHLVEVVNVFSESWDLTHSIWRTPTREPIAGTRNDLILTSSSKDITPFSRDEWHRRPILSLVAYFEADVGFGSVVTRLSAWDERRVEDKVISDRICGSKAKLIRLHTKRRVLSATYPTNLSENGGWKLDFCRTESQHTSAPISWRSSVGSDNNPLINLV